MGGKGRKRLQNGRPRPETGSGLSHRHSVLPCPTDREKYLKALLVFKGIDFPKTHDLEELMGLIPLSVRPELSEDEQGRLTDCATVMRYPGD